MFSHIGSLSSLYPRGLIILQNDSLNVELLKDKEEKEKHADGGGR